MSSTVTDVGSLSHLLPVGSRFSTLVRRVAHRGGMGRDHLLTKPEHGPIRISEHAISGTFCRVSRGRSEEKENPTP